MSNQMNKAAVEIGSGAAKALLAAESYKLTPAQKGGMTGALVGAGIGAAVGGAIGAVGGFLWQHKGKVAIAAAAVAAFAYREEIADFVGDKISGDAAGGDAFM